MPSPFDLYGRRSTSRVGTYVQPSDIAGATDLRGPNFGVPTPTFGQPSFGGMQSPLGQVPYGPSNLQSVMQVLGYHPAQTTTDQPQGGNGLGGFLKDNAGAVIGGAVGLYDAFSRNQQQNRDRNVAERELARQHQIEDEDRARRKAVDPARAAIIKRMLEQAQSAGQYTGYGS